VSWWNARRIIARTKIVPDLQWATDLARMGQVSIVAFMVAGTFLPLMYYDVYFTIMGVICATRVVVDRQLDGALDEWAAMRWRRREDQPRLRPGLPSGATNRAVNS
jgi:hypothetical protein